MEKKNIYIDRFY